MVQGQRLSLRPKAEQPCTPCSGPHTGSTFLPSAPRRGNKQNQPDERCKGDGFRACVAREWLPSLVFGRDSKAGPGAGSFPVGRGCVRVSCLGLPERAKRGPM